MASGRQTLSGSANFLVDPTSLVAGALEPAGGRVRATSVGAISGVQRTLSLLGWNGRSGVMYLSCRIRPDGTLGAGAFNGFFGLTLNDQVVRGKARRRGPR